MVFFPGKGLLTLCLSPLVTDPFFCSSFPLAGVQSRAPAQDTAASLLILQVPPTVCASACVWASTVPGRDGDILEMIYISLSTETRPNQPVALTWEDRNKSGNASVLGAGLLPAGEIRHWAHKLCRGTASLAGNETGSLWLHPVCFQSAPPSLDQKKCHKTRIGVQYLFSPWWNTPVDDGKWGQVREWLRWSQWVSNPQHHCNPTPTPGKRALHGGEAFFRQ